MAPHTPLSRKVRAAHLGRGRRRPRGHSFLSGPGSQTGTGERIKGLLTPLQPPAPPLPFLPTSVPPTLFSQEGWRGAWAPAWACRYPSPKLKAHRVQDTLFWPRPAPPAGWWARPRGHAPNPWEVPPRPARSESLPPEVSRFCDRRPTQRLVRLLSSPLQDQSSPILMYGGAVKATLPAPGPDNGRSGGAEPEVRLRTRSLAPANPGSGRARGLHFPEGPARGPSEVA